ncbi:glycosyl transferase family A [Bacillus cereus]|nr:glycosyl transferase family A [Bacillus cereus]PEV97051.1 glycosyl transferase family A [Bacillus cereus]
MARVTVLMPVYNGENYLREAIESILNQTYEDFELLIINDGSTDKSLEIINSFHDSRIRLISNEVNLKLIRTLNKGLDLATGEYIARMDSDDIAHPQRLELQVKKMDEDKEIVICGTSLRFIGKRFSTPFLVEGEENIKNYLVVKNCLMHPSVMIRSAVFKKENIYYDEEFIHAEDYELFQRVSGNYKVINLKQPLLFYRLSPTGISRVHEVEQKSMEISISMKALQEIGINFNRNKYDKIHLSKKEILQARAELENAYNSSNVPRGYDAKKITQLLWIDICRKGSKHGVWMAKTIFSLPMLELKDKLFQRLLVRVFFKCILKK